MTVKDIEEQARNILLDTDENAYRFTEKEVYLALKQGIAEVKRLRPESRYVNGLLIEYDLSVPSVAPAGGWAAWAASQTISMDEFFQQALIFFVVYRMYLKDDADTNNAQLAKEYLAFFQGEVA